MCTVVHSSRAGFFGHGFACNCVLMCPLSYCLLLFCVALYFVCYPPRATSSALVLSRVRPGFACLCVVLWFVLALVSVHVCCATLRLRCPWVLCCGWFETLSSASPCRWTCVPGHVAGASCFVLLAPWYCLCDALRSPVPTVRLG